MLSKQDLNQISARGISEEMVEHQLQNFKQGFPFLKIEAAAAIGNGIFKGDNCKPRSTASALYSKKTPLGVCAKVPSTQRCPQPQYSTCSFFMHRPLGRCAWPWFVRVGGFAPAAPAPFAQCWLAAKP